MTGTVLDGIAALYVAFGAWRGKTRKLSGELGYLAGVGVALALVLGFGAFRGLDALSREGRVGFLGAFVLGWLGMRVARRALARRGHHATRDWFDRTLPDKIDRRLGMVAGGVRALILAVVAVGAAYVSPMDGLHAKLRAESVLGKAVDSWFSPLDVGLPGGAL